MLEFFLSKTRILHVGADIADFHDFGFLEADHNIANYHDIQKDARRKLLEIRLINALALSIRNSNVEEASLDIFSTFDP